MDRTAVIKTEQLTKFYGSQRGVEELDLDVQAGEVYGFLGPNGAGKTTTINMLLDFRRPTSGSIRIFGKDLKRHSEDIRRRVGFVPGEVALYPRLTGRQFLEYIGHLKGKTDWPYVESLADRFQADLSTRISTLSKGNRQKIGLLQGWMHRPDLLILDEPSSGLDPLMQREFYALIKETAKQGRTIFLSSHIMSEVERICDRAAIVKEGRLVSIEKLDDLHDRALRHLEIEFYEQPPKAALSTAKGVSDMRIEGKILYCTVQGPMDEFLKRLARFRVKSLISEHASLEEIFFKDEGVANDS